MDAEKCRLLIVDDDPIVRRALGLALRGESIVVVGEASDGADALRVLESGRGAANAVLLDIRMPTLSGIATVTPIRARFPGVRIVLMTSFLDDSLAAHIANMGAHGFILKTAPVSEFVAALTRIETPVVGPASEGVLTERERSIAVLVSEGYSNASIADALGLSVNTVKTYTSRIYRKFGIRNRVQMANIVIQRLPSPPDSRIRPVGD